MKAIELLSDKKATNTINDLMLGANQLKEIKQHFSKIDYKPDYLNIVDQKEFFEFIDSVDIKILETMEEVNRCISFLVFNSLNNNINN